MRYAILAEPGTLALLGLGLFILTFLAVVALACIFALRAKRLGGTVFDFISGKMRKMENPVAPVAPATQVMPRKCPQCGGTLPPDAPEGLCPACLLQHGFATEGGVPPGQPSFAPPPISELAKLFPQLEILECLGRGGMGAVYKARQPRLDRLVALKILAPEKQNDLQFAERFEREARALARLNHPNIVTVFDFGEVSGQFYLLMEFVDGLTLRQLLQHGKLAPAEALSIVPKICEALQYAHEQGIVHRDIKPENILLDKQGRVKIADFGIAKIAGLEPKGFSLTGARDVMGTPHYMAPEQVEKPQTVDHRADIFSLGVVFYEMLTGEVLLNREGELLRMLQAQRADGRITDDALFFCIAWLAEKSVEDMHDTDRELKRLNAKMRVIEKREGFVDELDEFVRGQEPADWKALEVKWCRRYQAVEEMMREGITRWLRQHGEFDMADLSVNDRAAFDRRREAGRLFIFGSFPEISAATAPLLQ